MTEGKLQTSKGIGKWFKLLTTFVLGQGTGQFLQLVCGFLLINWLSKDAYADYTLIIAITGTTSLLVGLGFTQCLTGLIGAQVTRPSVVGRYTSACFYYRNRLLVAGATVLLIVLLSIGPGVGWPVWQSILFWILIVISLYSQAIQAIYSPVLLLEQRLKELYTVSLSSSVLRLVLLFLAYQTGLLSVSMAILIAAIQELIAGGGKYWITRESLERPPNTADLSTEKSEILRQTLPRAPSLVFTAFSGQLMVFLIGIFGTKEGIAEIGALSRIAMLFVLLRKSAGVLVGPYFSKLKPAVVPVRVLWLYVGLTLMTVVISLFVYYLPQPFLYVLGDDYQHLGYEVFLLVVATLIRVNSMLTFSVCNARKIVFIWYSIADVVPQLLVIGTWLIFFDLSVLANVLYFAIAMSVSKWLSKSIILVAGLLQVERESREEPK